MDKILDCLEDAECFSVPIKALIFSAESRTPVQEAIAWVIPLLLLLLLPNLPMNIRMMEEFNKSHFAIPRRESAFLARLGDNAELGDVVVCRVMSKHR